MVVVIVIEDDVIEVDVGVVVDEDYLMNDPSASVRTIG